MLEELTALTDQESLGKTRLVGWCSAPVADVADLYLPRSAGQLNEQVCVAREMVVVLLCPLVDEGVLARNYGFYCLPVVLAMTPEVLRVVRHRSPDRLQQAPVILGTYY